MYRLFSLSALYFLLVSAEPRTPKIYNVLISSKKNLSPSHALPVYEPVLRTTSLGIALPQFFYHSPLLDYQPTPFAPNFITRAKPLDISKAVGANEANIQDSEASRQQPIPQIPVEQFIPYGFTNAQVINNQNYYTPVAQENSPPAGMATLANPDEQFYQKAEDDPKTIIANLKRNPNIPDVPPPALPVKTNNNNNT